jgi:hypothetical protein
MNDVNFARTEFKRLSNRFKPCGLPLESKQRVLTSKEIKLMHKNKQGRNQILFHVEDVARQIDDEIVRMDGGGSLITRRALEMVDQAVTSAEILEKATEVMESQLSKFERVADAGIEQAKKRVSQLNDYNNRLVTSLNNLNKTLGDEKMIRALENADRIATALQLLDELEKKGSLQKIMAALK